MTKWPYFYCKECRKPVWPKWSWLRKAWICPFCNNAIEER